MYSIVIPVYRNEDSLPALLSELQIVATSLNGRLEAVFVVDGSPDNSYSWLKSNLGRQSFSARLCLHSRNFGSFAAIRSGLREAKGPYFAVMAADLQEPASLVADFFSAMARDEADLVVGTRESRSDPLPSRLYSGLFWWLYRKLIFPEIPAGGVDVFGCNQAFRDELLRLEELNTSMVAQLFWIGFRRKLVPYKRAPRRHGKSSWTFSRKVRYLLDSVYSFSDLPIRFLKWTGILALLVSVFLGLVVLYARLTNSIPVPGYAATVLTIVFFGGINALGLGVLGEYMWRTFENTKKRPMAIVCATHEFGPDK